MKLAVPFPPKSVYPNSIDTDYTLFKVYNTSESVLQQNLEAWATNIVIVPVSADEDEVWNDNGFINISGELIYFDSVSKDPITNKIYQFNNCIRNMGGNPPKYNAAGTDVRGFILAEHHNQLSRSIVNVENFIGYQNNPNKETLDWRIREILATADINDDFGCATANFYYYNTSQDFITGTTIQYTVELVGDDVSFRLEFGDGTFTTTELTGTHSYPPNAAIDPVLTITSPTCEQVLTAVSRIGANSEPIIVQQIPVTFDVAIPAIPEFPDFQLNVSVPIEQELQLPPIVFPCLDIGPFGPIVVPSTIEISPPIIIPSEINFENIPTIPDFIGFSPVPNIPSTITISPASIDISIDLNVTDTINLCMDDVSATNGSSKKYPNETTTEACPGEGGGGGWGGRYERQGAQKGKGE